MASNIKIANNSDATFIEVDAIPGGYSDDGIFYKTVDGKHYKIAHDGIIRAVKAGVLFDGTDQTSRINTILAHSDVHELIFDAYNKNITVSGTVTVPAGKKLAFKNKCKLIGSGTVSGGLVWCDPLRQCFASTITVQNLENTLVSVTWFGAVADFLIGTAYSQTKTDNLTAFNTALSCVKNRNTYIAYRTASRVFIPPTADDEHGYYLSDTWVVDREVEIYGDQMNTSVLVFPHGVVGIHLKSSDSGDIDSRGGFNGFLHDFSLWGNYTKSDWTFDDDVSFGILVQQNRAHLARICVKGFGSNGIYVYAHVPENNANNCYIDDCCAYYNGGAGIKFYSTDANKCVTLKGDFSYNVRAGYWDNSFLGNSAYDVHTASNCVLSTSSKSCAYYGGHRYICKVDNTVGVLPTDSAHWEDLGASTSDTVFTAYDNTKTYMEGAAFRWGDANQGGICNALYAEGDQYGGDATGTNIMVFNSTPTIHGQSLWKQNGHVYVPNVIAKETTFGGWEPTLDGPNRYVGWTDAGRGGTLHGFKYYGDDNIWRVNSANDDNTNATFFGTGFAASHFGRSATPYAGLAAAAIWFGKNLNSANNYRLFGFATAAPDGTTFAGKEFAVSDFLLNVGTDNTIIGWKCSTAGTYGGSDPVFDEIAVGTGGGGGGVTDHGALTGLADDDHTQYLLLAGRGGQTINDDIIISNTGNSMLKLVQSTGGSGNNPALIFRHSAALEYPIWMDNSGADLNFGGTVNGSPKLKLIRSNGHILVGGFSDGAYMFDVQSGALRVYDAAATSLIGGNLTVNGVLSAPGISKTLSSQYADASNVSTGETDLLSYTLPANTLANVGDRIVIEALFTTPSNGNSKSLKFYFGGANIDWTSSTIANGATIFMRITIFKTGSNAQRIQIERITGYSDYPVYSTSTETDTATILIKFAGTGAASNDITQRTMTVTKITAP